MKPTSAARQIVNMMMAPRRVNSLPPTMSASSQPNAAEPTMARPPIVGVPALVT